MRRLSTGSVTTACEEGSAAAVTGGGGCGGDVDDDDADDAIKRPTTDATLLKDGLAEAGCFCFTANPCMGEAA
jgi:hypothetical protein